MRASERQISSEAEAFSEAFRRDHPLRWWATLLGPLVLTLLVLALLALLQGPQYAVDIVLRAVAAFFLFGKFAILEPSSALSAEALFALIVYMDLSVAVFISFHAAFLFRAPYLGPKLLTLTQDGEFMLQAQPWMRRATFVGLVAFVMFPVAATGSIGGAIFGRLLGLRRRTTFLGVSLGSLLGCGIMYFGAGFIRSHIERDDPLLKLGGIVFVLLVLWLLNHRYRKAKQRAGFD